MDRDLLSAYLNDHLAGSTGGRNLARRAADNNRISAYGPFLRDIAEEIHEDREVLRRLMRMLGVRPNPVKIAVGRAGALVARARTKRRVVRSSPLSRVTELEALVVGVRGKLALWTALRTLQATEPRIAGIGLERLIDRAETQLSGLEQARLQAVQGAILGAAPTPD